MIRHIPELVKAGIDSFKIEGRVKNELYVATVVKSYRKAIDAYFDDPENYVFDESIAEELEKVSHREYTSGFFFGKPDGNQQLYTSNTYIQDYTIIGVVKEYDGENGYAYIEQRNRFFKGDTLEVITTDGNDFSFEVEEMYNDDGELIDVARHAKMIIKIKMDKVSPYSIIRKKVD
jgi:putative protease